MLYNQSLVDFSVRILQHLGETNDGRLPSTPASCFDLAAAYGIACRPWSDAAGKTSKLVCDVEGDWVIFYNDRSQPSRICRYIIHELAEYLAMGEVPGLFDLWDLPQEWHYTGEDSSRHHKLARFTEEVYAGWLERSTEDI